MSTIESLRPLAAVLISAGAIPLILASARRPNVRELWSVLAAVGKFAIVASMLPLVLAGDEFRWSAGSYAPLGESGPAIELALRADPLGMLFALLASLLWVFTAFYAAGYMRGLGEHAQTRFFAAFAGSLASAVGIAFAENLLTIFVFYELLSVATYPLVAHDETDEARAAGRKYLLYTFLGGGVLVLGGAVLVFALTGTTTFGETAAALWDADPTLARAAFGMLAAGFGVKAALMPLHSWLPDAMVAPTPVSGLLHAVAVVKSGVFGIARLVLDVFEPELVAARGLGLPLAAVAAVTLLAASVIALRQDRLKRRLAYSTVSQLSYIVLGLALVGPAMASGALDDGDLSLALVGGLLHIPAHAFMKLALFFCAGIVHVETHTDHVSEMDGIGKRMPLTMVAFAVAAAGMAGIPLVAGFVSKWFLLIGAVEAGFAIFAVALLVSGVLNVAYFWPIVYGAFFESHDAADAKPLVSGPLGGLAGPREIKLIKGRHGPHGGHEPEDVDLPPPEAGELAVDRNPSDHLEDADGAAEDAGPSEAEPDDADDADRTERGDGGSVDDVERVQSSDGGVPTPPGDDSDAGTPAARDDGGAAPAHGDGETPAPHGTGPAHPSYGDHVDHEGQHGGPGPGGWERRRWTGEESTWLMLGPILLVTAGAVVLGVAPYEAQFLELIVEIAAEVSA